MTFTTSTIRRDEQEAYQHELAVAEERMIPSDREIADVLMQRKERMTKETKYMCNLCRDVINPKASPVNGLGIAWLSGNVVKEVPVYESEHHLCMNCISQIGEISVRVMA